MWFDVFVCRLSSNLYLCVSLVFAGRCNNVRAADIVFLVDGSSSIGRANFLQVKGFISGVIKPFASSVSETGIRFGAIQYSDTSRWLTTLTLTSLLWMLYYHMCNAHFSSSRVEFTFTTYLNGTELVNAIENLNYKGGNTRTGAGLKFVADNFFNPSNSRDVPKVWAAAVLQCIYLSHCFLCLTSTCGSSLISQITILITDGKSQDRVQEPAQKLRSQGVHVFAVGGCLMCSLQLF